MFVPAVVAGTHAGLKIALVKPKYAVAELLDGEEAQRNEIIRPLSVGANP